MPAYNKDTMDKLGLDQTQLETFLSLAALPSITSTQDYDERADIAQKFFDGLKQMPADLLQSQTADAAPGLDTSKMTDANLAKYINDIRETGGNIPFDAVGRTLLFLLGIYALSALCSFTMLIRARVIIPKMVGIKA